MKPPPVGDNVLLLGLQGSQAETLVTDLKFSLQRQADQGWLTIPIPPPQNPPKQSNEYGAVLGSWQRLHGASPVSDLLSVGVSESSMRVRSLCKIM